MRKLLSVAFFSISCLFSSETFKTIHSFEEIDRSALSIESLVIFDVDEVLITPSDAILTHAGKSFKGWQKLPRKKEEFDDLFSVALFGTNYVLLDKNAPKFLEKLSKDAIPNMALTSCRTGTFGVIPFMEDWRYNQLEALGVHFSLINLEEVVFKELVDEKARPPLFKKGILYCGDFYAPEGSTKGKLLGVFLDHSKLKPNHVVFIDDELKNLQTVQEELDKRGISFEGYLFERSYEELDEKAAYLQIKTLLKEKKWLTDSQAKRILYPS